MTFPDLGMTLFAASIVLASACFITEISGHPFFRFVTHMLAHSLTHSFMHSFFHSTHVFLGSVLNYSLHEILF